MGDGDQLPVSVTGKDLDSEDRGGCSIGMFRCGSQVADYAGQRNNGNRKEKNPSHTWSPSKQGRGLHSSRRMRRPKTGVDVSIYGQNFRNLGSGAQWNRK